MDTIINPEIFIDELIEESLTAHHSPRWSFRVQPHDGDEQTPFYEIDKLHRVITLNLHEGQMEVWHSEARFTFAIAGTQSGKTALLPFLALKMILEGGKGDYLAVTSSFEMYKLKFLPALRVLEFELGIAKYYSQAKILEICDLDTGEFLAEKVDDPMHYRFVMGSAEAPNRLESATAKGALLDECGQDNWTLSIYEAILRRLSLSEGRVYGATTPYNLGWLKQTIYDPFERGSDNIKVVNWGSEMNPTFPANEIQRAREEMQPWKFAMFYQGKFTRPAGMIYDCYVDDTSANGHLVPASFELHPDWHRFAAVDPGIINMVIGWYAYDSVNDVYYKYREEKLLRGDGTTSKEHAVNAVQLARENKWRMRGWAIGAQSEIYYRQDFLNAGAQGVYMPPVKEVEKGIETVYGMLATHRLKIFEHLKYTREQFLIYSREVDEMGEPTPKIKDKEQFHHLDETRYFALMVSRTTAPRKMPQATTTSYVGRRY